jgi:pyruvate/2-oxoglutarate dehydrogenase complex dihydrolipoamide dehydrogenase (E3) component
VSERFDTIVIGGGPGGEVALNALVKAGQQVALCEAELIGGECTNWGCIPSKTLLRPADLRGESDRAAGIELGMLLWPRLAAYRDYMVSDHDDSSRIARYEERGVTVLKEAAAILGPGRVGAGTRLLEADAIVVATGAEAVIPPIPGLVDAGYWTNREATATEEIPASAVFVGGGVVSVELAQLFARFGSRVTVVGPDLAGREDPQVGALLREILEADGVELLLGRKAVTVRLDGDERVVELDSGEEARGTVVVVATGRRPRTSGIGLETVGVEAGARGIVIDDRCRAAAGVWAVGDCAGGAFTHVAKYQGRIAAANILGGDARADYRAVPRVVFTDPEVAAVGMTAAQAEAAGISVVTATIDLPTTIARPYTFEETPRGTLSVIADRERGVLVGAWAVAPLAGEWMSQAVLAIRAEIPIRVLEDTIAQFPTFSEAFGAALRALDDTSTDRCDHAAHPMLGGAGRLAFAEK